MKKVIMALCVLGLFVSCGKKGSNEPKPSPAPYVAGIDEKSWLVLPGTEKPDKLRSRMQSKLRPDGQEEEVIITDGEGKLITKTTNEYNSNGKIIRARIEELSSSKNSDFKYNDKGLLSEMVTTYKDGTQTKVEYGYDAAGRQTSVKNYDMGAANVWELSTNSELKYDDKGMLKEAKAYNGETLMMLTAYEYIQSPQRVVTKKKYGFGGQKLVSTERTTYVAGKDDLEEKVELEPNQALGGGSAATQTIYKYTFDEHGNWTKRTRLDMGQVVEISTRVYTYK